MPCQRYITPNPSLVNPQIHPNPVKIEFRSPKLHILFVDLVEVWPIIGVVVVWIQVMLINEASAPQHSDLVNELVEILTSLGHWNWNDIYIYTV